MKNNWQKIKKYNNYDDDASYRTWVSLYLKVYPKIEIFKNNFDFDEPERVSGKNVSRLVVKAKKGSILDKRFREELAKIMPVEIINMIDGFQISGDTDFNIRDVECHRLDNYSLMPRTGHINNEKGKKGDINDNFLMYINRLYVNIDDFIENPKSFNGRYKDILKPYREQLVRCARRAFFSLFDYNVEKYFFCVYFYGISKGDPLYSEAKEVFETIIKSNGANSKEKEISEQYWKIRRKILADNYGVELDM